MCIYIYMCVCVYRVNPFILFDMLGAAAMLLLRLEEVRPLTCFPSSAFIAFFFRRSGDVIVAVGRSSSAGGGGVWWRV